VAGDPRFEVSDIELGRPGPSYTVDTLLELHRTVPDSELYLIVGGDAAAGLRSWREPEQILSIARLAVAKRRGTARESVVSALAGMHGAERAQFFRMPRIGVSSTMIRRRVRARQPISYLVPEPVGRYIEANTLYGGPTS
jgi:nicotinate-nucleotide adenylyltransferase